MQILFWFGVGRLGGGLREWGISFCYFGTVFISPADWAEAAVDCLFDVPWEELFEAFDFAVGVG